MTLSEIGYVNNQVLRDEDKGMTDCQLTCEYCCMISTCMLTNSHSHVSPGLQI